MGDIEERPWPENAWPTAAQWLPWFLAQPPDYQLEAAERILQVQQEAGVCFEQNHHARLATVTAERDEARAQVAAVRALRRDWASLPVWGPDPRGLMILDEVDHDSLMHDLDVALGDVEPNPSIRRHRRLRAALDSGDAGLGGGT